MVLADDHAAVRRSVRLALDGEQGLRVVAEAVDLRGAVRDADRHAADVVVLDIGLSAEPSLKTIRRLRMRLPETGVVVLTVDDDPAFARHALAAGASGFVLKEMADADLAAAIRSAARGEHYVSPRLSGELDALRGGVLDA